MEKLNAKSILIMFLVVLVTACEADEPIVSTDSPSVPAPVSVVESSHEGPLSEDELIEELKEDRLDEALELLEVIQ